MNINYHDALSKAAETQNNMIDQIVQSRMQGQQNQNQTQDAKRLSKVDLPRSQRRGN